MSASQNPSTGIRLSKGTATAAAVAASTMLFAVVALLVVPVGAWGAFGDEFGIAPINGHPHAHPSVSQDVPALPGENRAFWAGTCDRTPAPAGGELIDGGIGVSPVELLAPDRSPSGILYVSPAPAPETLEHCIDPGAPDDRAAPSGRVWRASPYCAPGLCPASIGPMVSPAGTFSPAWRLAPVTQAGAHPDGSTLMALARDAENQVDGQPDNIMVDLPPGFVGDPNAVPKCTAEQFASRPLGCPPQSQIGILRLNIVGAFGAANLGGTDETAYPLYNLEPRKGNVAEIGFGYASGEKITTVRLAGKARTNGDFGVTAFAAQIPAALPVINQSITLWGVPWERANDVWRAKLGHFENTPCKQVPGRTSTEYIPPTGLIPECRASYDPSWGDGPAGRAIRPFFTNETDCNPGPVARLVMDSYQNPGPVTGDGDPATFEYPAVEDEDAADGTPGNPSRWETYRSVSPAVTGCEGLEFSPDIEFATTTDAADGASGLSVDLSIPQNNVPPFSPPGVGASQGEIDDYVDQAAAYWRSVDGLGVAHLKDTVVTLPAGVSVNPSTATGLTGCDDETLGVRQQGDPPLFDNSDPTDGLDGDDCPAGSRIGTVEVETPLLDETLSGDVVLGSPKSTDPQSGEMLRTFLVLRSKERGLVAKIYGSTKADPATGQLTATFANNPELPFDRLRLSLKGGPTGVLALPQRCGTPGWSASFTPWSSVGAPVPVADTPDDGQFAVTANCGFGFSPGLQAGMDTRAARATGAFSFRFDRPEGQQPLRGLTAKLPTGLLASVKDLPLCTNAQANAGACPAGSKIGLVDAKAGSGDPFVLEEKGEVFLTEGYKGGAYGLAVKIRPVAGPFRGAMELSPIIVRQAIHVDRTSAQVTAVSDPFPLIHHGVPLRVREVTVLVNRGGFMLNPSDCSTKQVAADLVSEHGTTANVSDGFQASGCASLAFKPKLALRLTGRKQVRTGKHPGVKAKVTQRGVGEAGIEQAVVRLPKSLALDPDNAQALCEFADGTKPDLENHCPKGSIVGRARAVSPLLNDPLVGNVYFVKNIRIDSKTGNQIRTLPMIIVALRGEISVNLKGESSTTKSGKLVNTFASVPDAPISQFNLNIRGGKTGILAVTRTRKAKINLCAGRHVAEADMDGQNGRRHDFNVRMKTPCSKRQTKAAKRKAKRAAAKRR